VCAEVLPKVKWKFVSFQSSIPRIKEDTKNKIGWRFIVNHTLAIYLDTDLLSAMLLYLMDVQLR